MPDDRLLHRRAGHSEKVSGLSDFEYRVWTAYLLTADDFGIMRATAVTLQAADDSLERREASEVQRALSHLIEVDLLQPFTHQGREYVYQRDWQTWQHVRYPRETTNPAPPPDALSSCCSETQKLFAKHPGGKTKPDREPSGESAEGVRDDSGNISETSPHDCGNVPALAPEDSGNFPETLRSLPRAGTRETANANGLRLTADGERLTADGDRPGADADGASRFERFWAAYPKHRARKAAQRAFRALHVSEPMLEILLAAIATQRASRDWRDQGGRFIPDPATWLTAGRWDDELQPDVGSAHSPRWQDHCEHQPPCLSLQQHEHRTIRDAAAERMRGAA